MKSVNARRTLAGVLARRNYFRSPRRLALACCTLLCSALLFGGGAWGIKAGPATGAPPPAPAPAAVQTRGLPVDSNATITPLVEGAVKLSFPQNGYMRCCGKNVFKDKAELHNYIAQTFPFVKREDGVLGSTVHRAGRYQRIDARGNPTFTFGDPVLDLTTNEAGVMTVAGQSYDLRATETGVTAIFGNGTTEIGLMSTVQAPTPVFRQGRSFGGMISCFMAKYASCVRGRVDEGRTIEEAIEICNGIADVFWILCSAGPLVDSSLP